MATATAGYCITRDDIARARVRFEENEPRDLFYRMAIELVDLTRRGVTRLTLTDALAGLLQTWNKNYYRFHKAFDAAHFAEIDALLLKHKPDLDKCCTMTIEKLASGDEDRVITLFEAFEAALGPVGAAKALHLLAPRFFPLWDRKIAVKYVRALKTGGGNGSRYLAFMRIAKRQCEALRRVGDTDLNLLKGIDEYNYCKYTHDWI